MSELNWDDIVEIDPEDAEQEILEDLEDEGLQVTSFQEGDPTPATARAVSERDARLSAYAVFLRNAQHNDTATGVMLTKLSKSRFENTRNEATSAQREITLTCSATTGPYSLALGDVVLESDEGQSVRNIEGLSVVYPVTLPAGGSVTLLFEAETPGTEANLSADSYTRFVTTLAGVTVTDDTPSEDGTDQESDARLRARNSTAIATRSLEPIAMTIENLCLEAAPTVFQVGLDDENPRGPGTFDVYLAGEIAASPTEDVDAVQAALDARVMGDTSGDPDERQGYAQPAPELELDIEGTVYYAGTGDQTEIETAVEDALEAFLKTIPLGGFDYVTGSLENVVLLNEIENAIRQAHPLISAVALTTPAGNVAVGGFQKVTVGAWTLTYTATG